MVKNIKSQVSIFNDQNRLRSLSERAPARIERGVGIPTMEFIPYFSRQARTGTAFDWNGIMIADFGFRMEISKRVIVMGHGKLVFERTPDELRDNDKIRQEWLEV